MPPRLCAGETAPPSRDDSADFMTYDAIEDALGGYCLHCNSRTLSVLIYK